MSTLFYGAGTMKRDQVMGERKLFSSKSPYLYGVKMPVKCSFLLWINAKMV